MGTALHTLTCGLATVSLALTAATLTPALAAPRAGSDAPPACTDVHREATGEAALSAEARATRDAVAAAIAAHGTGRTSVAVIDHLTCEHWEIDGRRPMTLASTSKIAVLEQLLMSHGGPGQPALDDDSRDKAELMIRASDNAATNSLWSRAGGRPTFVRRSGELGLDGRLGDGAGWGLSQLSARDELVVLDRLVDGAGGIDEAERAWANDLLRGINGEQSWGVGAAGPVGQPALWRSPVGTSTRLKNGWAEMPDDAGWVINTVGRLDAPGHAVSVAIMTDGQLSYVDGVAHVSRLCLLVTGADVGPAAPAQPFGGV